MNKLNFVSCVSWIPKGVAKEVPNRIQMSKEDIQMKIEQNKQQLRQMYVYKLQNSPFNGIFSFQ